MSRIKRVLAVAATVPLGFGLSLTVAGGVASATSANLSPQANCTAGEAVSNQDINDFAVLTTYDGLPAPTASQVGEASYSDCGGPP